MCSKEGEHSIRMKVCNNRTCICVYTFVYKCVVMCEVKRANMAFVYESMYNRVCMCVYIFIYIHYTGHIQTLFFFTGGAGRTRSSGGSASRTARGLSKYGAKITISYAKMISNGGSGSQTGSGLSKYFFFSRDLGRRIHLGVEVTESSTNKQHHRSIRQQIIISYVNNNFQWRICITTSQRS